jgi:hypothetical protein
MGLIHCDFYFAMTAWTKMKRRCGGYGARLSSPEDVVDILIARLSLQQTIGAPPRHKVMDERAFSFLVSLLDILASHPAVRFHTFQSLLGANDFHLSLQESQPQ